MEKEAEVYKAPVPPQRRSFVLRHLLPKHIQRLFLQQLCPVLAQMKMYRRAGQCVLDIVREAKTVQQICLLPRLQLIQCRVKLPQSFCFDESLLQRQRIRIGNRLDPQQPLIAGCCGSRRLPIRMRCLWRRLSSKQKLCGSFTRH